MMRQLTERGQQIIEELSQRYGVSGGAVMAMLESLIAGGGTMAQFNHPELGGLGQWTRGGMTMVGDMFNNALKAKVDGLCSELANLLAREPVLTRPASSQSQSQSQGGRGNAFGDVSLFVSSASGTMWRRGGRPISARRHRPVRKTTSVTPTSRRPGGWPSIWAGR